MPTRVPVLCHISLVTIPPKSDIFPPLAHPLHSDGRSTNSKLSTDHEPQEPEPRRAEPRRVLIPAANALPSARSAPQPISCRLPAAQLE